MADLSLPMLNQVLEATLAVMILLLALSVAAIVRIGPMAQATTESNTDTEAGAQQPIRAVAAPQPGQRVATAPAAALWSNPVPGSMRSPAPPAVRRPGLLGGRYEARHVRGRMPKPRPPAPAGPPWGPATPPPSRPQQSSERWT